MPRFLSFILLSCSLGAQACHSSALNNYPWDHPDKTHELSLNSIFHKNPLMIAAERGDLEAVKTHLPHYSIDDISIFGSTALIYAVKGGSKEVVEALLRSGAQVNHQDETQMTPFLWAIDEAFRKSELKGKYLDIAKLLFQHGADMHAFPNSGVTALQAAEKKKDSEVLEFLNQLRAT